MSEIHNPHYAAEVIRTARQMVDSPQYAVVNLDALREALRAYRDAPTVALSGRGAVLVSDGYSITIFEKEISP